MPTSTPQSGPRQHETLPPDGSLKAATLAAPFGFKKDGTPRLRPLHSGTFKPGKSGNPAGGIRKGMSTAEVCRAVLSMNIEELQMVLGNGSRYTLKDRPKRIAVRAIAAARQMERAIAEGDTRSFEAVIERGEGKVPIVQHLSGGPDGQPIKVVRIMETVATGGPDPTEGTSDAGHH